MGRQKKKEEGGKGEKGGEGEPTFLSLFGASEAEGGGGIHRISKNNIF